jgi:hypothetical protein
MDTYVLYDRLYGTGEPSSLLGRHDFTGFTAYNTFYFSFDKVLKKK